MAADNPRPVDFDSLPITDKASRILKERTPKPEEVIFDPTIEFLDPNNKFTREERGRVIAMGDRTAISYHELGNKVINGRKNPDATSSFYLQYALGARGSDEISHTSILEQLNPGESEKSGDSPIVMEGISILSGLRDICSLRHLAFEAFSSRGGVFPDNYWRIPNELREARVGVELEAINREVHKTYLHLTQKGLEYYLGVLTPEGKELQEPWRYRWRVLNHALDDSRQVTNQSYLNHLSMHPNSALSLGEAIKKLSSNPLPETRETAGQLRGLLFKGLPTIAKYTDPSEFQLGLSVKKEKILTELFRARDLKEEGYLDGSQFLDAAISNDAERMFLGALLANDSEFSLDEVLQKLDEVPIEKQEEMIDEVFEGFEVHDKPPQELEMVQIYANFNMSIGAFYESARHRLATNIVGKFDSGNYTTPKIYKELDLTNKYDYGISLNQRARDLIRGLGSKYSVFIPYFASRADIIPVTMRISGMDLFHYLKLRGSGGAHPDIKKPSGEFRSYLQTNSRPIFKHLIKK